MLKINIILNEAYKMNPIEFFDKDHKCITVQALESPEKTIFEQDMLNSSEAYLPVMM